MKEHHPAGAKSRRNVTKIVLSYVVEGEEEENEQTVTLSREGHGVTVDGVVWSPSLMEKLAYLEAHGPAKPVPRRPSRPEDGWQSRGRPGVGPGSGATAEGGESRGEAPASALRQNGGDEDCLWLHDQSCTWISLCDNPWPL